MKTYTTCNKNGKTYLSPGDILILDATLPGGFSLSEDQIELRWQYFSRTSHDWGGVLRGGVLRFSDYTEAVKQGYQTRQVAKLKPKVETESTDKVSYTPPTGTVVNGYVTQEKYDALVQQLNRIKEIVNQIEL